MIAKTTSHVGRTTWLVGKTKCLVVFPTRHLGNTVPANRGQMLYFGLKKDRYNSYELKAVPQDMAAIHPHAMSR